MIEKLRKALRNDDVAVSAVIGTILMIAATVVLGGVIYAAVNGFGDKNTTAKIDAVFRAQGFSTDPSGKINSVKITYISGPAIADGDVTILVSPSPTPAIDGSGAWTAGRFKTFAGTPGTTYLITVSVLGNTVLDTTVSIPS